MSTITYTAADQEKSRPAARYHITGIWPGLFLPILVACDAYGVHSLAVVSTFSPLILANLPRVTLLAPLLIMLVVAAARRSTGTSSAHPPMPWFVLGFIAMIALNSTFTIPPEAKSVIVSVTTFLQPMALAAMGLETDIGKLYAKGLRPLAVGATASIFISLFSLTLIKLTS